MIELRPSATPTDTGYLVGLDQPMSRKPLVGNESAIRTFIGADNDDNVLGHGSVGFPPNRGGLLFAE